VLPKIHIGKLPIMLRSNICVLSQYKHLTSEVIGECKMDPGGYRQLDIAAVGYAQYKTKWRG